MEFPGIAATASEQEQKLFFARQIATLTVHFYQLYNVFLGPTLSLRPYEIAAMLLVPGASVAHDVPGPNVAVLSVQHVHGMLFLRVLLRCRLQESAPRVSTKRQAASDPHTDAARDRKVPCR